MNKIVKILVEILLALVAVGCVYGIYRSIMKPVNFNKEKDQRKDVAVQRLKDIRTLEVASSCRSAPTTTPSPWRIRSA